jgi:hypothetical protein
MLFLRKKARGPGCFRFPALLATREAVQNFHRAACHRRRFFPPPWSSHTRAHRRLQAADWSADHLPPPSAPNLNYRSHLFPHATFPSSSAAGAPLSQRAATTTLSLSLSLPVASQLPNASLPAEIHHHSILESMLLLSLSLVELPLLHPLLLLPPPLDEDELPLLRHWTSTRSSVAR